jgi:hypothetical protein
VTRGKKAASGKQARKLKIRKETIRDLDVKGGVKDVKGGATTRTIINQLTCFLCHTK